MTDGTLSETVSEKTSLVSIVRDRVAKVNQHDNNRQRLYSSVLALPESHSSPHVRTMREAAVQAVQWEALVEQYRKLRHYKGEPSQGEIGALVLVHEHTERILTAAAAWFEEMQRGSVSRDILNQPTRTSTMEWTPEMVRVFNAANVKGGQVVSDDGPTDD